MKWNCLDLKTTNLNEGLVILNQVSKKDLSTILQSKGIQMSLKYNIWLISTSSNSTESILEFLLHGQQFLKIGLNAKIFVIDHMSNVTQVIGNGGFETTIKVNVNGLRVLKNTYLSKSKLFRDLDCWKTLISNPSYQLLKRILTLKA